MSVDFGEVTSGGARFERRRMRRGTPGEWAVKNPILMEGEQGLELITNHMKIGDGLTRWNDLPYFKDWDQTKAYIDAEIAGVVVGGGGVTEQDLTDHVNSAAPHPVYDDGVSLVLLYDNAKV